MTKYSWSCMLLIMLGAISCEKTIKVNLPALKNELVVAGTSNVTEPLQVKVSRTASYAEEQNYPDLTVNNATVKLYVDGVYTETLVQDSALGYISTTVTQAGKQYAIKITAPSFPEADATVTAPSEVTITNITRIPFARKDPDGNEQDQLTITFSDPPGTNDYYIIKLTNKDDSVGFYTSSFCVNSPDAGIETVSDDVITSNTCLASTGIFLRDAFFNGKQKQLVLYAGSYDIAPQFNGVDTLFAAIQLLHVPEAFFRFSKSYQLAQNVNGDPFSEPANVYTNVTNGQGIFSIINRDSVVIR